MSSRSVWRKLTWAAVITVAVVVTFAAFSHRLLPESLDECQRDVSHAGHVAELPLFHCIGHSEWDHETGTWDHVHPWVTPDMQPKPMDHDMRHDTDMKGDSG